VYYELVAVGGNWYSASSLTVTAGRAGRSFERCDTRALGFASPAVGRISASSTNFAELLAISDSVIVAS
jgi:hypothetical protein